MIPPLWNKLIHKKILATVIALRRTQLMRWRRNRRMKWRAGKKDLQSRDEGDPRFPEGLCQGGMWSKCLHPPSSSRYLPHQGTRIEIKIKLFGQHSKDGGDPFHNCKFGHHLMFSTPHSMVAKSNQDIKNVWSELSASLGGWGVACKKQWTWRTISCYFLPNLC